MGARPEKAAAVADVAERFSDSSATLLTEYRGLKVQEIAEVRNALREVDADLKVFKNTLARIALREAGIEGLDELLTGPTGIVFVRGDVAGAAKALDEATKKFPVLVVKGGTLRGGKVINAEQAQALARIEPREVQLAKIAMLANSPIQQTVNVFAALLRDFGSMLAQVVSKKESGELPSGDGAATAEAAGSAEAAAESAGTDDTAAEAPAAETDAEAPAADAGGDTATEAGTEGSAESETATAEDVGVPSPEGDTPAEQAESSAEETPAADATTSDDTTDEASENEEEK